MKRELIYMDAKSSKFWSIEQEGSTHTVAFGRIGTKGQSATKSFPSEEAAKKDADKLIKEKLGKGYVDASEGGSSDPGDEGLIPLVAFSSINHSDEISSNVGTFIGQRVQDYDPEKPARSDLVYRFRSDYDEARLLPNLEHFLATEVALKTTALIIGCWQADDCQITPDDVIQKLVSARDRLPNLAALYLGDIVSEECEISWIQQSDLSPLLQAFPKLQLLRARGGEQLQISAPSHANLRALALETGGLNVGVVRSIGSSDFPNLEYFELWLGAEDYGRNFTVADLQPILSGRLFGQLKYLGLRNYDLVDELAGVVVNSPLVQRLETLDLSLGNLGDEGARALLKLSSPRLKKLNLHHNYINADLAKQLKALPFTVDLSDSHPEEDEEDRYVAVGE